MTLNETRQSLLDEVFKWRNTKARWEAEAASRRGEASQLLEGIGEAVLTDEHSAEGIHAAARDLRDRADIADKAAIAAVPRIVSAEAALLEFDAAQFDAEADELERLHFEHVAKVERLLKQLSRLEGHFEPAHQLHQTDGGVAMLLQSTPLRSFELEQDGKRARLRAAVLREKAAGADPTGLLKAEADSQGLVFGLEFSAYYSAAVWGPAAVLPTAAYERRVEAVHAELMQHDDDTAIDIEPLIKELQERHAALQAKIAARLVDRTPFPEETEILNALLGEIRRLRERRDDAPRKRAEIVSRLEQLTGEHEHAA